MPKPVPTSDPRRADTARAAGFVRLDPARAWADAWRGIAPPPEATRDEVLRRYSEPHRQYHTLQHLEECLSLCDELIDAGEDGAGVRLALWFHDAVYDPRSDDNETLSADWARRAILDAGGDPGAAARVHALVMATAHRAEPDSPAAALVVDIDLSVLGADPARFDEYERQVRAEYAWVEEAVFRERRAALIERFLERKRLYLHPVLHARLEARARANLRRSLERLHG